MKRVDCSTSKQVSCSVTGKHRTDQSHWTKVGHDSRSSLRHQLSHLIYVCMLLSSQDIALLDSRNKGVFVNFGRCIKTLFRQALVKAQIPAKAGTLCRVKTYSRYFRSWAANSDNAPRLSVNGKIRTEMRICTTAAIGRLCCWLDISPFKKYFKIDDNFSTYSVFERQSVSSFGVSTDCWERRRTSHSHTVTHCIDSLCSCSPAVWCAVVYRWQWWQYIK